MNFSPSIHSVCGGESLGVGAVMVCGGGGGVAGLGNAMTGCRWRWGGGAVVVVVVWWRCGGGGGGEGAPPPFIPPISYTSCDLWSLVKVSASASASASAYDMPSIKP